MIPLYEHVLLRPDATIHYWTAGPTDTLIVVLLHGATVPTLLVHGQRDHIGDIATALLTTFLDEVLHPTDQRRVRPARGGGALPALRFPPVAPPSRGGPRALPRPRQPGASTVPGPQLEK